jgi:hypothetical protein
VSEPEGAIRFSELMAQVGDYLGHGYGEARGDPAWGTREAHRVLDAAKGGVHQVYKPPVLPGDREPHAWTFLRPVAQLLLPSGADAARLPPDFGGLEGQGAVRYTGSGTTRQSQSPVKRTHMGVITAMRAASPTATGPPEWMAEEPVRGVSDERGQRWRLAVYPTSDQAYTLWLSYYFNAAVGEGAGEYVYGGQDHRNTFLSSVKAWASVNYDGKRPLESEQYQQFMIDLAASVGRDRRRKGETLGYNGDGRGRVWSGGHSGFLWDATVRYGGQVW